MKNRFILFTLLFLFPLVQSYRCFAEMAVVIAESQMKNGIFAGRRIVQLSMMGKEMDTLVQLSDPAELIQCQNGAVRYINRKGEIWQILLSDQTPKMLVETTPLREEAFNKILWRAEENRFLLVNNKHSDKKESSSEYIFKSYSLNGTEDVVASGSGRISAIWQPNVNVAELVADETLFQINLKTKKITPITVFKTEGLSDIQIIRGGFSVFVHNGNEIEVKEDILGPIVLKYKFREDFAVVRDFLPKQKKILAIILDSDISSDRLVEIDLNTKSIQEIHRSKSIGSACYIELPK